MPSLEALRRRAVVPLVPLAFVASVAHSAENDPLDFSLGELMTQEVITVAKKRQEIGDVAAAVYVVSADDIARTGVTTLPDALRLVPGVQVAAIANNRWAVSVRGFNGRFANRLLVMVDGRTVYSPLFSGTFWEALDVPLEEIDRIEVIRGPGASIWGANAVNGIVNIITKWARASQGTAVKLTAGTDDNVLAYMRHGGVLDGGHYRVSYQGRSRSSSELIDGSDGADRWYTNRLGTRADRFVDGVGELGLVANAYSNRSQDVWIVPDLADRPNLTRVALTQVDQGVTLGARLTGDTRRGNEWSLQLTADYRKLVVGSMLSEERVSLDADGQYRFAVGNHDISIGSNLRYHDQDVVGSDYFFLGERKRTFGFVSAFIHDDYALVPDKWTLSAGLKFEHHTWTGNELQPNVRLAWNLAPRHILWAAVSEASRTPARVEYDVSYALQALPGGVLGRVGEPNSLHAERMTAYELGYRGQPSESVHVELAAYRMKYRHMRSLENDATFSMGAWPTLGRALSFDGHAEVHGVEASLDWQPGPRWRARFSWSAMATRLDETGDALKDLANGLFVQRVPSQQASMHVTWKPATGHVLDAVLRYVGPLKDRVMVESDQTGIDAYTELDLQYAFRLSPATSFSITGRNLLHDRHAEFGRIYMPSPTREIGRSVHFTVQTNFD